MALKNLSLSEILTPTPLNPGTAGWDAGVSQFMKDRSSRTAFQTLTILETIQPTNGAGGQVVMTCPPGFICIPIGCMVFLRGGTIGSPQHYELFRVSNSAANSWAGNNGASYISFANLTVTNPILMWARPGTSLFTDAIPEGIPLLDGDDPLYNTLMMRRQAGNVLTLGLRFFGLAYAKADI